MRWTWLRPGERVFESIREILDGVPITSSLSREGNWAELESAPTSAGAGEEDMDPALIAREDNSGRPPKVLRKARESGKSESLRDKNFSDLRRPMRESALATTGVAVPASASSRSLVEF